MKLSIKEILAPLDPYWDRIIRRPMSGKEVDQLQKQVGVPIPTPFSEYLMQIGLFQDLTWGEVSSIEMYVDPEDFVFGLESVTEILSAQKGNYFPFGHNGAGDVYCIPTANDVPCRIHFVDHETSKITKKKDFGEWLQSVVAKVVRGIRRRPLNEHKAWCVQFSFEGLSFADLIKLLRSVGKLKTVDSDWKNPDTSPSGVTETKRAINLNGTLLTVIRLECEDWDGPQLYFDMQERLHEEIKQSQIRLLDALFKKNCAGYKLIDWGPLDSREIEPDED